MSKQREQNPCIGKRVEVPCYTDSWMMGARFGVVEKISKGKGRYLAANDSRGSDKFGVRLDKRKQRIFWFFADDCKFV